MKYDMLTVPTPCYILDEVKLTGNLKILNEIKRQSDCKILLAQKAFSMYSVYPLIGEYIDGTTASSLYEARLGFEEMGGETHIFAPAYTESDFTEILSYCGHIVFNSFTQWNKYGGRALGAGKSCGIRVNPGYSEISTAMYDPCGEHSRLGVQSADFRPEELRGLDGLHFHALCEQGSETLERVFTSFEKYFGEYLYDLKWLNMGGGHHLTRSDYNLKTLYDLLKYIREKYEVEIYLEPGEAVALDAGVLVAQVLEVNRRNAILDVSAACHMPDVLEMPYRPVIDGAGTPGEYEFTYRLGGNTCLAGDIIGDYSFTSPLEPGQRLILRDMAIYTMVKNNTFNGIALPSIGIMDSQGEVSIIKEFFYEDFKNRLS